MDIIGTQLAAFASVTGSYGATFALAGLATYLVTAYFAYIGQRTVSQVNTLMPDIERIRRQFHGDSKEISRALLKLSASHGINRLGFLVGSLPIVVALACVVVLSIVVANQTSGIDSVILPWIHNLAAPDPLYLLPAALGLAYWVQRRLILKFNTQGQNGLKAYIATGIPVFVLIMSTLLPAGVVLYWLMYAIPSVMQQYVVFQHVLSTCVT
jgi:YidC/Oxa1 family membrane protein insertase